MTEWLVVGLGNPGREYARHRHNVGFMAVENLSEKYGTGITKNSFQSVVQSAKAENIPFLLQQPQTFMNLSGDAVGAAMRYYKIPIEQVIVIHDELDIPLNTVRIKQGGGNGGHNGLRSIDQQCGVNYWRVRIGIGHPGDKDRVTGHVLGNYTATEQEALHPLLTALTAEFPLMFAGQSAKLMTRLAAALKEKSET